MALNTWVIILRSGFRRHVIGIGWYQRLQRKSVYGAINGCQLAEDISLLN